MRRSIAVVLTLLTLSCGTAAKRNADAVSTIREHAHVINGDGDDYDALLASIGNARVVLLGEATHGTHEFYRERRRITERLIHEKGFGSIALEANWSDAERVDRYVRHLGSDRSAEEALRGFTEFPRWMWRNRDVVELVEMLRRYNEGRDPAAQVGVYGIDLYGVDESITRTISDLEKADPALAKSAEERYRCISRYGAERYAMAATTRCAESVLSVFNDVVQLRSRLAARNDLRDVLFSAEQNARVVKNAEEYHRESRSGRVSTWNIRDRHMLEMLAGLDTYRGSPGSRPGIVLWAHNSHVGDARATSFKRRNEWNIGQLLREVPNLQTYSVGFTTYSGTVVAAHDWGGTPSVRQLRPALADSYCGALHAAAIPAYYVILRNPAVAAVFRQERLQRAVGVIYRPETELASHYVDAQLAEQFDAVVHIDQTSAITPLD